MNLSPRQRGLAASAAMCAAAVLLSGAAVYDHLASEIVEHPSAQSFGAAGHPLSVRMGDASLDAGSFRLDPTGREPHLLREIALTMPAYAIRAPAATMMARKGILALHQARLESGSLEGTIDTLALTGERIVFENVEAYGRIAPLEVVRFTARRISLPERSLENRGVMLGKLVEGVSKGGSSKQKEEPRRIRFGFTRLEIVLTVLFQRGYILGGYAELTDGTVVRVRRGTYTARHHTIYVYDVVVTGKGITRTAPKGKIYMKSGDLVLLPPSKRTCNGKTDTLRKGIAIPLK